MISIQEEMRQGDGLQRLLDHVTRCYQAALEDSREYAIDFGAITRAYQASLDVIISSMVTGEWSDSHPDQLRSAAQTAFRVYKDAAERQLHQLRTDLDQTSVSLAAVLQSLEYDEPAQGLRSQVAEIEKFQKIDDLQELKGRLRGALLQLEKGLDEMEKRNHLAISDLQAEISMLHSRVAVLATQKAGDRSLRAMVDERMAAEPFSLLIVRLAGLSGLQARRGDAAVAAVLHSAKMRLASALDLGQTAGLWDERTLGAIVQPSEMTAAALTRLATTALSGKYSAAGEEVTLHANAGVLEWRPPDDRSRFLRRLQDLLHLLRA